MKNYTKAKKNIEEISDGIFLVKNYISKDTARFLIDSISPYLIETPRNQIYGALMGEEFGPIDSAEFYNEDSSYNISIDIHNSLLLSINNLISEKFKAPHKVKSYFFSCMLDGAVNDMHMDNYHEDENGDIHPREKYISNRSGLLYLNDDYIGGEIVFPNQGISIKPEAGSLLFFEGDHKKPHAVNQVVSGPRYNLVTFYEPVN